MATTTTTTVGNRCVKCDKSNAILKCGGCLQDFCYNHLLEHRQELSKRLDDIEINCDLIRQSINQQSTESEEHPLMKQIDQWEQESIDKIRQTAEETRKVVLEYTNKETNKYTNQVELKLNNLTDRLKQSRNENDFLETNLNEWDKQLTQLKEELNKSSNIKISYDSTRFITRIYADIPKMSISNNSVNAKWMQMGVTVAGGNKQGTALNQLSHPWSVYIDNDQTIYVTDQCNKRIVQWKSGATNYQIVADGNENNQLHSPANVVVDEKNDSLIICDRGKKRVVRWPRQNGTSGETIISNIDCWGLTLDNDGYLYVSDVNKNEVRRYEMGNTTGIIVAGGNGAGDRLNQLSGPYFIFVDQDHSVYVSDRNNHRVMKWMKDAKEGIVVAGDQGQGNGSRQLSNPYGVVIDQLGTVYVVDQGNNRVMRWLKGARQGNIVVGGNGQGGQANQFMYPCDLSFDQQNNLYVVDCNNHRVQKFHIETNSTM